jgi:hypothetical protein
MLIACLLFAVGQLGFNAVALDTWMDEGKYLMKGYCILAVRSPYSTVDPSLYCHSACNFDPLSWGIGVQN